MRNLKNVLICWKKGLQKILAFATIVLVGLLLTACCNQKEIVQPTIKIVPTHKIDTCFVVKQDTLFCFETDTLSVETYIHDTIVRLRVETKQIIVRDTLITKIEQEKAKKENTETKEKIVSLFFAIELVLAGIFLLVLICRK